MSKIRLGKQRRASIVGEGRRQALRGLPRRCPYTFSPTRALWYEGFDKGETELRILKRERLRKFRTSEEAIMCKLWRLYYRITDTFGGEMRVTP